jgi:hypothetical protein
MHTLYASADDYVVTITHDGRFALVIASGTLESGPTLKGHQFGEMHMWDIDTVKLVRKFRCESCSLVNSISVTADGERVVAGSHNGPLQV